MAFNSSISPKSIGLHMKLWLAAASQTNNEASLRVAAVEYMQQLHAHQGPSRTTPFAWCSVAPETP